jgi:cell division protease FtsH
MLREAEQRAIGVLKEHRSVLDELVQHLLDKETVDGAEVYALAQRPIPSEGEGMTVAPGRVAMVDAPSAAYESEPGQFSPAVD